MPLILIATLLAAPADPQPQQWYGWQTALMDAGAIGLGVAAGAHGAPDKETTALASSAIALYLLGGPAVHALHGRWNVSAKDLGLRVGIPLAAGLLFGAIGMAAAHPSTDSDCGSGCVFVIVGGLGAGLGGIVAASIDAASLAWEPIPPQRLAVSLAPLRDPRGKLGLGPALFARF